ncbi:MAG: Fpg/Nei family DNA glycosylase [Firmicutes bacterium]|jgi:formamidopyrimidine-DNA glycosylase|nr:Fpg/Nei family DNA glycosylase [Bacillota bacterium]
MPELPEIRNLAAQMCVELNGRRVSGVEIRHDKCLNLGAEEFKSLVLGKTFGDVLSRGKWIFARLEPGLHFLLSLGMGGDVLFSPKPEAMPDKYRLRLDFEDGSLLTIGFWWFGYAHVVTDRGLAEHKMTADLGPDPLNDPTFTRDWFNDRLSEKKGNIKAILMDQRFIAGIGNVYIQDILFRAGLHPDRRAAFIPREQRDRLYTAIRENLERATSLGGLAYERDLYGRPGRFKDFLVGYREGAACPECGATIQKIRTGSTSSFICPRCQA